MPYPLPAERDDAPGLYKCQAFSAAGPSLVLLLGASQSLHVTKIIVTSASYRAVAWSCDQKVFAPQELDNFFARL